MTVATCRYHYATVSVLYQLSLLSAESVDGPADPDLAHTEHRYLYNSRCLYPELHALSVSPQRCRVISMSFQQRVCVWSAMIRLPVDSDRQQKIHRITSPLICHLLLLCLLQSWQWVVRNDPLPMWPMTYRSWVMTFLASKLNRRKYFKNNKNTKHDEQWKFC